MRPFKPKTLPRNIQVCDPLEEQTSMSKPWMLRYEIARSRHHGVLNSHVSMYCARAFATYEETWAYFKEKEAAIERLSRYSVIYTNTTFDERFRYPEGGAF